MRSKFKNQIVGLVRFSYPAKSGFTKTASDIPALEDMLYDPDRLERRFHLFESLTIPSLLAQEDQGFETVFLIGKTMPSSAVKRLKALVAPLKGALVVALPSLQHYNATQRALGAMWSDDATHHTSFRLDDDDALDSDFIGRLKERVAALVPVCAPNRPLVIGCNRGFFLELSPEGNRVYDVVEKLPLGIGLAMTVAAGQPENIFRRNHRLVAQHYTVFTDGDLPAFIRTVHADNDSDPTASGATGRLSDAQIEAEIAARFPFTSFPVAVALTGLVQIASDC